MAVIVSTGGMTNPMTASQDMIVASALGLPARLAAGVNGQVLMMTAGSVGWGNSPSGFANPMTTAGDLIIGGTLGAASRLGVGANGQVLTLASGVPTWMSLPAGNTGDPMAYGAAGDGVADDTSILQSTVNTVTAAGTGVLDLTHSPKTYKVSGPVVLPDTGIVVIGRQLVRAYNVGSNPPLDLTCDANFTGAAVLTNQSANSTANPATTGHGITISGVSINMKPITGGSGLRSGIRLQGSNMTIRNCYVESAILHAFHLCNTNVGGFSLTNSNFCTDNFIVFNEASRYGGSGIITDQGSNITDSWVLFNKMGGSCIAYGDSRNNTGPGILIAQAEDWAIEGNHVQHNAADGIVCQNASQLRIVGNYVNQYAQAAAASTTYSGIRVEDLHEDGLWLDGNISRLDEAGTGGGGAGGAAQPASATILYYSVAVNTNSGSNILVRANDNNIFQYASGPCTSIGVKGIGNTGNSRTLRFVGSGNGFIGPGGAINGFVGTKWLSTGNTPPTWIAPGITPVQTSGTSIPMGATANTYGALTTILQPSNGATFIRLRGIDVHWGGTFGAESANAKIVYTWDDGSTTSSVLGSQSSSGVQTPTDNGLMSGTIGSRCVLVQAQARSTISSSAVTINIDALGDQAT